MSSKNKQAQPITKFRRVLWESQPFEDNYTPPSFPYCVVFNEGARYRSFGYLLLHSLWVLDHISLVILFFDVFLLCDNASISSISLFIVDSLLVVSGLIISFFLLCYNTSQTIYASKITQSSTSSVDELGEPLQKHTVKKRKKVDKSKSTSSNNTLSGIKSKIERTYIVGILLIILCPFLRTLTESISTDTIWTMTIICCIIHLLTADYEFDKYENGDNDNGDNDNDDNEPRITATVSLNAAVFMSVLLASRLKSNDLALSFLLFSIILFGGSIYIIRDIKLINIYFNIIISFFICFINYGLIYIYDDYNKNDIRLTSLLYVYQYSMFVVVILGPIGFYRIQQYKVTIAGPWTYDTQGEASQYMLDSSNIKKRS